MRPREDEPVSGGPVRAAAPGVAEAQILAGLLDAAVRSDLPESFRLPWSPPLLTADVVIPARNAVSRHYAGRTAIFWGLIDRIVPTRHDGVMLGLASAADGVAVLLTRRQVEHLGMRIVRTLPGRHVMVLGEYRDPGGERAPYVRAHTATAVVFLPDPVGRGR